MQDMKKLHLLSIILLAGLWMLAACHNEKIDYSINQSGQVDLASIVLDPQTEPVVSVSRVTAEKESFIVGIYTEQDERVQEWTYSEMPDVFTLKVGKYRIKAHAPQTEGAAFDTPYCAGESGLLEITKDNLTKVGEVKCTLQNIKVTLKYSDALKAQLGESFRATVSVGQERLEYTRDETRSGFFHGQAGENTVDVVLSGEIEGAEIEPIHKSYSGLALGTELVLTLNWQGVNGDPGTGGSVSTPDNGIAISGECVTVNESADILPDEDEILDFGDPKIEGEGFDISQPVTDLNQPVVVLLSAPEGIAHVWVQITSDNESFAGVVAEMFGTEPFDLAYPGGLKETLKGLQLPVEEEVINQQLVRFDVSQFIPLLKGEFAGMHRFNLTVEDTTGKQVKATLSVDSRNAQ